MSKIIGDLINSLQTPSQYVNSLTNSVSSTGTKTNSQSFAEKMTTATNQVTSLRFPANVENEGNGNVIRFKISMPSESKYIEGGEIAVQKSSTGAAMKPDYMSGKFQGTIAGRLSKNYDMTTTQIDLYMPPNISSTYQSNWESTELGLIGKLANGVYGLWNNPHKLNEAWHYLKDTFGESAKTTFAGLVQDVSLGKLNAEAFEQMYSTAVENPYAEVLFKSVSNRQFQFSFKFIPRNATEQATIESICSEFVFHMAPEFRGEQNNVYMLFPSIFDIQFIHQNAENPHIFKISTCALTSCTVNHSPDGQYTSHADGSPFATELTLSFLELPILSKEDHKRNY